MQASQIVKTAGDAAAHTTVVATILGYLPGIAALFSILWLAMQMSEKIAGKPFHQIVRCGIERIRDVVRRIRGR